MDSATQVGTYGNDGRSPDGGAEGQDRELYTIRIGGKCGMQWSENQVPCALCIEIHDLLNAGDSPIDLSEI